MRLPSGIYKAGKAVFTGKGSGKYYRETGKMTKFVV